MNVSWIIVHKSNVCEQCTILMLSPPLQVHSNYKKQFVSIPVNKEETSKPFQTRCGGFDLKVQADVTITVVRLKRCAFQKLD